MVDLPKEDAQVTSQPLSRVDEKNKQEESENSIALGRDLGTVVNMSSLSAQQRAIITERQVINLQSAQLLTARPPLAPQPVNNRVATAPVLHLVPTQIPALILGSPTPTPIFSIVTMEAYRFAIAQARKILHWECGQYVAIEIIDRSAILTLSFTQTEIQISPIGRIALPVWARRRLCLEANDQILLQHSIAGEEDSLTINSASELFRLISTTNWSIAQ